MGLPADWKIVEGWIFGSHPPQNPRQQGHTEKRLKHPEIPTLDSYKHPPPFKFWDSFPKRALPKTPSTPVHVNVLEEMIDSSKDNLRPDQIYRAEKVIHELKFGVVVPTTKTLPGNVEENAPSVANHGRVFTDTLAHWITKNYVAGPFHLPPTEDFRSNSMMAIEQKGKVRIVMNLSTPEKESFNDAIEEDKLEKIKMSSAKQFGYSIIECGRHARMWKFDMVDAYKNLPAATSDLRLQGFAWLGKYFVETQQAFGSKAAVAAFDRLGHTIETLTTIDTKFPRQLIHRTLDDVPIVTPHASPAGEKFAESYKRKCKDLGIRLAPQCPEFEKAFEDSTKGTVLGITFDTNRLIWHIRTSKLNTLLKKLAGPIAGDGMALQEMQQLMGSINDFGQMCPLLKTFRLPLIEHLTSATLDPLTVKALPAQARTDLKVWAAVAAASKAGLPIPHRPKDPGPNCRKFVSDAAGAPFVRVQGVEQPIGPRNDKGVASISFTNTGHVWFAAKLTWPNKFLLQDRDKMGHAYGCKTATLEAIGLILPFLSCPEHLQDTHAVAQVDNEAVVFGWDTGHVRHDKTASIIIRAMKLITAYLNCVVTVQHLPRKSTQAACMADRLSRISTTTTADSHNIKNAIPQHIPDALTKWLENPTSDWNLANNLLMSVQNRIKRK